jgi:prevent-host-death family protein
LILSILGDNLYFKNVLFNGGTMPIIKPISSLRNKTKDIASFCHEQNEPVYLTKNGEGDLVVMSIEHYERLKARVELFGKLSVAQAQAAAGEKGFTHSQVMKKLRQRLHGK